MMYACNFVALLPSLSLSVHVRRSPRVGLLLNTVQWWVTVNSVIGVWQSPCRSGASWKMCLFLCLRYFSFFLSVWLLRTRGVPYLFPSLSCTHSHALTHMHLTEHKCMGWCVPSEKHRDARYLRQASTWIWLDCKSLQVCVCVCVLVLQVCLCLNLSVCVYLWLCMGVNAHIRMFIVTHAFFSWYCRISVHLSSSSTAWYGAAIEWISCTPHFFLRQVYWHKDVSLEDQKRVGGLKRRAGALKEENNRNGVFSEMAYATLQG